MLRRRRRAERPSPQAEQSLRQAERDIAAQRAKHAQEAPLREVLRKLRERNHLAEKFGEVLSQHRPEG
jgi:hypothetical protein